MAILSCLTIFPTIMLLRMMVRNKEEVLCRVQCSNPYVPEAFRNSFEDSILSSSWLQLVIQALLTALELLSPVGPATVYFYALFSCSLYTASKHISGPPFYTVNSTRNILLLLLHCYTSLDPSAILSQA